MAEEAATTTAAAATTTAATTTAASTTDTTATAASTTAAATSATAATTATTTEQAPLPLKDWATLRTEIAHGDEKVLKRLERYSSPKDVAEALIAAQNKIAEGGAKGALPKDSTPEQLAEWRKDNGIPDKPEGYAFKLSDGLVVGDVDKSIVDGFLKTAHDLNMPPAQVERTLDWFFKTQEKQLADLHANDNVLKEKCVEDLRQEWGSEYKLNLGIVDGLLNQAPSGVKEALFGGRLADGTPLGNNPDVLRWLASVGRELNPTSTVTGSTGVAAAQAIEGELANLTKMMGDHKSEYWKGPEAEKNQSRYRELVDVQSKIRK